MARAAKAKTAKAGSGGPRGKAAAAPPVARSPRTGGPVLILATRESGGSLVSSLLGGHPDFADAPQINLLAFEAVWQLVRYAQIPRDSHLHGLVRYLAERLTGEQTVQAVQAAQRWLARRAEKTAAEVHAELRALAAPQRFVDYSPLVAQNGAAMRRALAALPDDAVVVHVTRDPLSHGRALSLPVWQSIMTSLDFWDRRGLYQAAMDVFEVGEQYIDWSTRPPVFDPQFAWARSQKAALELRAEVAPERWVHVDAGTLEQDPDGVMTELLTRLGAAADGATLAAMRSAQVSCWMRPGPYNAPFGMDFEMMDTPVAAALAAGAGRRGPPARPEEALPWRGDGQPLLPEVAALAARLGYGFDAPGGTLAKAGRMVFSAARGESPATMGPA
jgi:Sulfotransferase family